MLPSDKSLLVIKDCSDKYRRKFPTVEDNYYFRCHYALLFEISQNIIQVGSFSVKTRIVMNTLNH